MKNRWIYILAAVLVIATGIVIVYQQTSTIKKELRDFAVPDTAQVDKIFMVDKMNQTVLLERHEGGWTVNGKFEARKDAIYVLLKTIARLDVKSPVSKAMMNTVISQMAARSIKVEVYRNGELHKTFYVGGPTSDHQGTFMMLENSSVPFIMHIPGFFGYLSTRFFVEENMWRSQGIFNVPFSSIQSVDVTYPAEPARSFQVINNGPNQFSVMNGSQQMAKTDTLKTKEYLGRYISVNFESVVQNMQPGRADSISRMAPYAVITLTQRSGKTGKLTLWKMPNYDKMMLYDGTVPEFNPDALYGRVEDDSTFVTVQYFVVDPLLVDPAYFMYRAE